MMVKPKIFLCTKIFMIWTKTAMGDKNDQQISSTQLGYHASVVVAGGKSCIIQCSGKVPTSGHFQMNVQIWKK